jgi:hypothetical protein
LSDGEAPWNDRFSIAAFVKSNLTSFRFFSRVLCGVCAGLGPVQFSGHSLRSGFLTGAARAGASVFKTMEVSLHKSVDTLRGYVRRADLFREHAGSAFLSDAATGHRQLMPAVRHRLGWTVCRGYR